MDYYIHDMSGPSGFFLPNASGSTPTDSENLELIHTSSDGFSELYRGCKNGRFFVYKALKEEFRGDLLYEELLRKDFNLGFSLSHLGICQYFGMIAHPSIGNSIVMEWIDGKNLKQLINQGKVDKHLSKKIICEICDALEYIHKKQIIHRDLKPENIMITDNGQNVKIIDFGLSDADSYCTLKAPAGTRAYASPELLAGEKIDARSDIWSLGVIIHELDNSYRKISSGCIKPDKDKRYSSAAEVKRAIMRETVRKVRNIILIAAIAAIGTWFSLNSHNVDEPEAMTTPPVDTTELAPTPVEKPVSIPSGTPTSITKEKASKNPLHNSDESLDSETLDDMLKNAAELIH